MNLRDVQSFYSNIQFPIPTDQDFMEAYDKIKELRLPPSTRRNLNRAKFVPEDSLILDKFGFGDIHRQRIFQATPSKSDLAKAWADVGKLLSHPVMRTALDSCMIARVEDEKLSLLLPTVYHLSLSEQAIKLYRHYFADFEMFGRNDWTDYLKRIQEDTYVYSRYFTALTRPKSEVFHLCQLPSEKQFSDFLKNVLAGATYKFDYYSRQNTPHADAEARRWAKVGFEAGEKFEKFGSGDATDFAKLVQTEFEYVTPQIDTLDEEAARQMRPQIEAPKDETK